MTEPRITRDFLTFDELYHGGYLVGLTVKVTNRHGDKTLTVTDTWELPKEARVEVEDWAENKASLAPELLRRAMEALNIEYQMFTQLRDYLENLESA